MLELKEKFEGQMKSLIDRTDENKPIFSDEMVKQLYTARCLDLGIPIKKVQMKKFVDICNEKCVDRKLNLAKMLLGRQSAALIAKWIESGQIVISHLLLAENNLGDDGVSELVEVIANSATLVAVDLAMNNISPRCAHNLR